MILFWYCADDHIAEILHYPALGHVPLWIVLVIGLALTQSGWRSSQ